MTKDCIPCGAMEEVHQVCSINNYDRNATNFYINVRGHGSIVLAKSPSFIKGVKWVSRPAPEII